ncbi:MAG: helix-turn-helix transcriptional regulator [Lachnospiraceae bacterium]|nr:helix-turn-helix transcriptional regulator [Lachnospiraceae bacterium]
MILADKIIALRKKNGWSQEELAEKVGVSRQSVSKWEGAQAVPDLNKILQLSQAFGVSTDYLLRDEIEEAEYTGEMPAEKEQPRRVTMEEANEFLAVKAGTAGKIALATFLCILSPISLLLLAGASEENLLGISENFAAGVGLIVLALMIAAAVAVFIICGMKTSQFEYLEKEVFETEYGVNGMVKERQKQYRETYTRYNVLGTVLCIAAVIPLFAGAFVEGHEFAELLCLSMTLVVVGIGVIFFIIGGINWASMQKLLQEGDYSRQKKTSKIPTGAIATVYWLVTVAIYLGCSFRADSWDKSWVIWPVAGVLFAALMTVCGVLQAREKR